MEETITPQNFCYFKENLLKFYGAKKKKVSFIPPFCFRKEWIKYNAVAGTNNSSIMSLTEHRPGLAWKRGESDLRAEKPLSLIQRTTDIESSIFYIYAGHLVKYYKGNLYSCKNGRFQS